MPSAMVVSAGGGGGGDSRSPVVLPWIGAIVWEHFVFLELTTW